MTLDIDVRGKLVVGNWKMHGSTAENDALLAGILAGASSSAGCGICVPFPYLFQARDALRGSDVAWGAQNLSEHPKGAYTGEISAAMLCDLGCSLVIVGHSERRALEGESSGRVAAKYRAAIEAGLTAILCVGETLEQREGGATERVVAEQLDTVLEAVGVEGIARGVVAYEPVWAIGTGRTATPRQAQDVHAFIRGRIGDPDVAAGLRILYGGSVKGANAAELFAMPDIDGGLIGGASLDPREFLAIRSAASAAMER